MRAESKSFKKAVWLQCARTIMATVSANASKIAAVDPKLPRNAATATTAPLRRAVYVNVEKLVRSQYSIDLQRLKDELDKLETTTTTKTSKEPCFVSANETRGSNFSEEARCMSEERVGREGEERLPGSSSGGDARSSPAASETISILPTGARQHSLPHLKKHHQSRLQPPRNGFNLCL